MDNLSDLGAVLRSLEGDKVTERKKAVEQLRNLLGKPAVALALTQYSQEKKGKHHLTWNCVIKAAISHVHIEAELLQKSEKDKENVSTSVQRNRKNKKVGIGNVFKFVVRSAEKHGGHVKSTLLLNHIVEIMKGEYTCMSFGTDYSSVLLKNVLGVRKHWLKISSKIWHDLLVLYCQLFLNANCSVDRVVVAQLLRVLMIGTIHQCDIQPKKILIFFTEVFKNIKQQKESIMEPIVGALNVFVTAIAPNSRTQVCKLGEAILPGLLHLWNNYAKDTLKDDLVQFLLLQMQAHHPAGARNQDSGAFAVDWNLWKSHLRKIYEVLYNELDQLGGRQKFSSATRTMTMKDSYIELAADACHQLYTGDTSSIEVTQVGPTQIDSGIPVKKRRLMSGWAALRDNITSTVNTPQIIPWLQLLAFILDKYPTSLLEMDAAATLKCLLCILTTCKGSEAFKLIFGCFGSLARSVHAMTAKLDRSVTDCMADSWLHTWTTCLSIISSRQAEADGYQQQGFDLLTSLLQCDLVNPGRQVWNMFLSDVAHPTPHSLAFLSTLLASTQIPENYQPSILGSSFATEKGMFPLRRHLLGWVMRQFSLIDSGTHLLTLDGSVHTLAKVVVQLMMRNLGMDTLATKLQNKILTTPLEEIYLLTSFDCDLDFEKQTVRKVKVESLNTNHVIPVLVTAVSEHLQDMIQQHLQLSDCQPKTLELLANDCSILSHCILESRRHCLSMSGLHTLLQETFTKLTATLSDFVKREGTSGLLPVIKHLQGIVLFSGPSDLACFQTAEIVRGCLPDRLIDLLIELVNKKLSKGSSFTRGSTQLDTTSLPRVFPSTSRLSSSGRRILDDFDLGSEEDEEPTEMSMDISFEDEGAESQDEGQMHDNTGVTSLLSPDLLTESQILRNAIVHFLCLLTGYERHRAPGDVTASNFDILSVRRKVEEVLSEEVFDPELPADLQLMDLMIQTLLSSDHHVTDNDLENVMDVLRRVARVQCHDQQVCELILGLMVCIAPHLTDPDDAPSTVVLDCRAMMLQLISAFWRLQSEGAYHSNVRLCLAQCMAVVTQHDPKGLWGTLRLARKGEEETTPEATVPAKFPHCLIDGSLPVRLFVSTAVKRLFVEELKGQLVCQERTQQHAVFDLLYEICNDMMDIQGRMSVERQQDERLNRTASLLLTVSCAAMASHACEKKALFALCQAIREKNVNITLVTKILGKMSGTLGYPCMSAYLKCHLPFLVSQWLDLRYPLADFPYQLLGLDDSLPFYRNHSKLLVAQQFVRKDLDSVDEISVACNQPVVDSITDCLPEILVHVLPVFAIAKSQQKELDARTVRKQATANACYDQLMQQLGQEVIDKSIVTQLGKIVVRILSCLMLQEPGCDDADDRTQECEYNPPSYSKAVVRLTLDYLTKSFSGNTRSLVMVLAKTPDGIEQVLLDLCLMLWREHRVHERLRVLQMMNVFVSMLLQELSTSDLGGAWAFVQRRIITTFLQTLDSSQRRNNKHEEAVYQEQITVISLRMLKKVCVAITELRHQELGKYLDHIVDVTSQLATEKGNVGESATELLRLLLLEKADQLQSYISTLDALPDNPAFAELAKHCERIKKKAGKKSLEKVVEQVLRASTDHVVRLPDSFARTLVHLVHLIDSNKTSLVCLSSQTEGIGMMSRLICDLLQLTKSSSKVIAEEAGRCLGAIGPINLQTFALPSRQLSPGLSEALTVYQGGAGEKYCVIFHRLHQYLIDPSVEIIELASVTLKKLLATPAGIQFTADYVEKVAGKDNLFLYLQPFRCSKSTKASSSGSAIRSQHQFQECVNKAAVWESQHRDHGRWVMGVCVALLQSGAIVDTVLALLQPVCEAKVEFCEMLLPYLIHDVLCVPCPEHREVLSRRFNNFFNTHCTLTSNNSNGFSQGKQPKSVCVNKESVLTMLKVINYLRTQKRPSEGQRRMTAWDNNFWLDLDYLSVAVAAQNCAAHFSAILFAEIWCDLQRESGCQSQSSNDSEHKPSENLSQGSLLHSLTSLESTGDRILVQTLLLEALQCTGDPDAIYGCGAGSLPDAASRVETYLHEKQWEKAVVTLDIQMQQPTPATQLGLLTAVQSCGMDYLLRTSLGGLEHSTDCSLPLDMAELQYQAAWRAGQWDHDMPQRLERAAPLHHSLYSCLHAVRDQQPVMATSILNKARCSLLQSFDLHLESCRSVYPLLSKLQCLRQFEVFIAALTSDKPDADVSKLLREWGQKDITSTVSADFEFVEPVQSLRLAIVRLLASGHRHHASSALQDMLLVASKTARKAGHYQLAERHLHELQVQATTSSTISLRTQLEAAQLFWARSEHTTAKHILKALITKCHQASEEDVEARRLLPKALGLYGNWLAETRSETPSVIMEQYLEKTVELLQSNEEDSEQEAVEGYLSLARFADSQYQNIVNHMSSPTFEAKQALMNKAAAEYEKYKVVGQTQKDRYLCTLEKQSKIDQQEVAAMIEDRERFLLHAVRCYAQCLLHGDTHDLRIFRLMSLWFDNSSVSEISSILQNCSKKLKSYKFLPLLHQLAARMGTKVKDNAFQAVLNRILERAALEHPHHTLWVVLALAHANKDEELLMQGRSAKRGGKLTTNKHGSGEEEDRVHAARSLLEHLKSGNKVASPGNKVAAIVRDMEALSIAYVQLANWSAEQYRRETKPVSLPKSLSIMSLKELSSVAVPSLEVPVDASGRYDNIVTIQGYQPTFRLAGGINLPKIITCRCSDGVDRRQLVKGRDDLRQDAVMQQVFGLVNRLLLGDAQASHRQLHIRTYKVVPLSRRSGLLEWCEGTQPIGEYLVGSPGVKGSGAHTRYRPKDWTSVDCRKHMMSVQTSADTDKKHKVYMEACKRFQPVFRFFFMEKFLDPAVWFQRRLSYTRSVATNSIVGYILGLGDRHVMNILIDCNSAELIHIDLGVAFEAGYILPTPETVPFRLTRDIVDGMGVTGVEGVFRRCCEKTMEVMRGHQESLMTIVQVLLYDPLSEWTLSPHKAYALQAQRDGRDCDMTTTINLTDADLEDEDKSGSQEPVNKLAERVLLRLQQKLQGLEDGVALSVAGQVNHLIQAARDPHNLSRLYPGWQPYI